jgi:ferredoxin
VSKAVIPLRQVGVNPGVDLGRVPVLRRFLHWKHARTAVQIPMLVLAGLIIFDGLVGPSLAPKNLAGVLPWVHWRGFIVLALLAVGNVFCMACPFMLPRRIAKRVLPASLPWPNWLPGKWLAVGLLIFFFWVYEAYDLWASPWLTAWVILAYFTGAFVIDGFFKGAAFCKHVCPIGQFNFVNSLASPFEVTVRSPSTCAECQTKDCISGRHAPDGGLVQNGCELWLFQERKVGNMDCTFCLDCVQACPYDNVGVIARNPLEREIVPDPNRSGIGRFSERLDLAAMALVIVFGAFLNAFGMVSPVYDLQRWLADLLGVSSEPLVLAIVFVAGLILLPVAVVGGIAWAVRAITASRLPVKTVACRFAFALVPLGFGMWLGHYGFHFFTGALTIVPVFQSFFSDLGLPILGEPRWELAALLPVSLIDWIELLFMWGGLLVSLRACWLVADSLFPDRRARQRAVVPWALLCVALFAAGLWLLSQPMDMRGTVLG